MRLDNPRSIIRMSSILLYIGVVHLIPPNSKLIWRIIPTCYWQRKTIWQIPARMKQTPPTVARPNAQSKSLIMVANIIVAITITVPVARNKNILNTVMNLLSEHLPPKMKIQIDIKHATDPVNPKHSKTFSAVNLSTCLRSINDISMETHMPLDLEQYCHSPAWLLYPVAQ